MSKIGIFLAGCGNQDGSEIFETAFTMLALAKRKINYTCLSVDAPQVYTVNHLTGERMPEKRNMLVEAARLGRGQITSLSDVTAQDFDALILPGGGGAYKNIMIGEKPHPQVAHLVREMHKAKKPLGFICIMPFLAAQLLGKEGITLTSGNNPQAFSKITQYGAFHKICRAEEICLDEPHKIVSTPAFMCSPVSVAEVAVGIDKLVAALLELQAG